MPGRRAAREQEPDRVHEERVGDEQRRSRASASSRLAGAGRPRNVAAIAIAGHRRRPQHRRLPAGHRPEHAPGPRARPTSRLPSRSRRSNGPREREDERDVRAADREQVAEAGGAEVVDEIVGQRRGCRRAGSRRAARVRSPGAPSAPRRTAAASRVREPAERRASAPRTPTSSVDLRARATACRQRSGRRSRDSGSSVPSTVTWSPASRTRSRVVSSPPPTSSTVRPPASAPSTRPSRASTCDARTAARPDRRRACPRTSTGARRSIAACERRVARARAAPAASTAPPSSAQRDERDGEPAPAARHAARATSERDARASSAAGRRTRRRARSPTKMPDDERGEREQRADARSHRDQVLDVGEAQLADAADVLELVDGLEPAPLLALGDDRAGQGRADAGQRLELGRRRGVEVDGPAAARRRSPSPSRRRCPDFDRRGRADVRDRDALPVGDLGREVQPVEVGVGQTAARGVDRVDRPARRPGSAPRPGCATAPATWTITMPPGPVDVAVVAGGRGRRRSSTSWSGRRGRAGAALPTPSWYQTKPATSAADEQRADADARVVPELAQPLERATCRRQAVGRGGSGRGGTGRARASRPPGA